MRSSRREFLARGGALAGVMAFTTGLPAAAQAGGARGGTAVAATALSDSRRQTYRALAETVLTDPAMRLDPSAADIAASEFASTYATWPAELQQRADRALDALDQSSPRPFGQLDRGARAEHLRASAKPSDDQPVGAERRRLDMAEAAASLAEVTVGPGGAELDRPIING
ncbi:MAG: hypothetical protein QOD73_553 [Solirubrobacteraceae bacterium]|nr:hypothetical protein [Solirubrobacteraceae bacterium]